MYVNHYELKEQRKLHSEEVHDKIDFQNYIMNLKHGKGSSTLETLQRPETIALLQALIQIMNQRPMNMGPGGMRPQARSQPP